MVIQTTYKTIEEIVGTNPLRIPQDTDVLSVGLKLLSSHMLGAPVVDSRDNYVGFISESDLIKALQGRKDLSRLKAGEIMNEKLELISETTSIDEAIRHMQEKHLHNLPVVRNGRLLTTITRHDLLRILMDVGLGIEQ